MPFFVVAGLEEGLSFGMVTGRKDGRDKGAEERLSVILGGNGKQVRTHCGW